MIGWIIFLLGTIGTIIEGFVFQCLWGWFIVPKFTEIKLTLPIAVGIVLIA